MVDEGGKLWWIQDAYTTTDRYPYSANLDARFNYIRNSVKVVVDAYNGTVNFYAIDPGDPLLQMYSRAFPGMFRDFDEMPAGLKDHVRYPIGLFSAQAGMYLRYHVTDPQVFSTRQSNGPSRWKPGSGRVEYALHHPTWC